MMIQFSNQELSSRQRHMNGMPSHSILLPIFILPQPVVEDYDMHQHLSADIQQLCVSHYIVGHSHCWALAIITADFKEPFREVQ